MCFLPQNVYLAPEEVLSKDKMHNRFLLFFFSFCHSVTHVYHTHKCTHCIYLCIMRLCYWCPNPTCFCQGEKKFEYIFHKKCSSQFLTGGVVSIKTQFIQTSFTVFIKTFWLWHLLSFTSDTRSCHEDTLSLSNFQIKFLF